MRFFPISWQRCIGGTDLVGRRVGDVRLVDRSGWRGRAGGSVGAPWRHHHTVKHILRLLRNSSIFPPKGHTERIRDISVMHSALLLKLCYSKTVQFQQREPIVILPFNSDVKLCLVGALLHVWSQEHGSSGTWI